MPRTPGSRWTSLYYMVCFLERSALWTSLQPFFLRLLEVCLSSLGCPGVWGMKGLALSVFHSEQFRPSQLCGTCVWKGRKMFYISLTKQGSPVPFFFTFKLKPPTALIIPSLVSTIFCVFFVLKTARSHFHIRGLYGRKKRMVSRCECVF